MKPINYIWVLGIVVVVAAAIFFVKSNGVLETKILPNETKNIKAPEFEWMIDEGEVTLLSNKILYPIGHYGGNCEIMASTSWKLIQNEVSGVICYFAGGGQELGIFYEDYKYILKEGVLDEGNEETPPLRGNFRVLRQIP